MLFLLTNFQCLSAKPLTESCALLSANYCCLCASRMAPLSIVTVPIVTVFFIQLYCVIYRDIVIIINYVY